MISVATITNLAQAVVAVFGAVGAWTISQRIMDFIEFILGKISPDLDKRIKNRRVSDSKWRWPL